jgi:hypothetical protein
LNAFWRAYDKGERRASDKRVRRLEKSFSKKKDIHLGFFGYGRFFDRYKAREPLVVSPSALGTVRTFFDASAMRHFTEGVRSVNSFFKNKTFKHAVFQPTHLLSADKKNLRLLEQVFRAPNIQSVLYDPPHSFCFFICPCFIRGGEKERCFN